jgi:hypothetical protein
MKTSLTALLFFISFISFGQEQKFVLSWEGSQRLETEFEVIDIPQINNFNTSYTHEEGFVIYKEWDAAMANANSATLINPQFESIGPAQLYDLKTEGLQSSIEFEYSITSSRGKRQAFMRFNPIINDNGNLKRLIAFELDYSSSSRSFAPERRSVAAVSNSVLSTGNWYRFYVEESGVYRLSRNFLSDLGINMSNLDPRRIRIYGNGGQMIPLSNAVDYPLDPVENAIQVVGEEDGVMNSNDYVLFYAQGPHGKHQHSYNQTFNSNLNLFTDRTYYYITVDLGPGKRITDLSQPQGDPDIIIDSFQDYQFYEIDEENIVRIGRRWFGEDFDLESERQFEFNFPNLISTEPVDISIAIGSVAPIPTLTSMGIGINGTSFNLNLTSVDLGGSLLASASVFNQELNISNDDITVQLNYNNGGNPAANAYLDYINIEATRALQYTNAPLFFSNSSVDTSPGVAQYNISNAGQVEQVWDVSDRFNVGSYRNTDGSSNFSFKVISGAAKSYLAFSSNDLLLPKRDNSTRLSNQNLKGSIFENSSGQFQDVDYLIISPNVLIAQAERLANINRRVNGLNVQVVSLEDIYIEFSTGNQDISAIRNFIRYVYQNASTPAERVRYVCLFGEGSYDYKDRIANNTNLVPPWYSENSFSLTGSFVSDDFYGMMDPSEGEMRLSDRLDIAMGRILAEDNQRARDMVDKIEAYYAEESFGSWRNNILMISDDVDERWERILQETTDNIGDNIQNEKPFFNIVKIHSDAFQQQSSPAGDRYPEVNGRILDRVSVGASVVNYFGHGGEDGLAKERILDKNDAQAFSNLCKFNCFVTVTCEYTKFDDPNRITAGEYTYWNTNGGAINLITTTRQIFVTVGVAYNVVLEEYLFAFGSNDYPSVAEALRLTKIDNRIAGSSQKRLVYFIGDPAMKLSFAKPNIRLTRINDLPIGQSNDTLKALSYTKLSGEIVDENGLVQEDFNGVLTATVFDKPIKRQTLANDGVTDGSGELIKLDFDAAGEILFKGQATVSNGVFEFDFIVPRDIGIPVGQGKVSFYAKENNRLNDRAGFSFDINVGGINENAEEDNEGPLINLFMNDENFVNGGITNSSPTLLAKLRDDNGINTASGIGHDIVAILDGDETNPFVLNDYYQAEVDDFQRGVVSFPFRDLEPGLHTLTLRAWDVYNNSSVSELQFVVFNENEELVIDNVLNYPNPFVDYTEFWFNHNSADQLDISVQIFTVSGKLVRTLNGQTGVGGKSTSSLSRDIVWDGRDDFGDKIGKGTYIYKLKVKSNRLNKQVEKIQKLVIL